MNAWAPDKCKRRDLHTSCPPGYLDWHDWASQKAKTHKQERCPECGLLTIWVPKARQAPR